jgi:hypothetical protein
MTCVRPVLRLCLDLRKVVDDCTRVVNQINDCLKEFYPQAVGLFYKTDSAISIAFLQEFSDPQALLATTKSRFRAFLKQQNAPILRKPINCTARFMHRPLKRIR